MALAINALNKSAISAAISLALLPIASSHVSAQQSVQLEEITVTAQRREESLQDVPVAVTALSPEQLESNGVATLVDVARFAPNTTLQVSRGTNTTLTAYIRGIGQQDPLWGFEPGVGLYIDDVYVARPQGAVLDIYDVAAVEVLRGPQGTLYGKNTIGGAVKYVTKGLSEDASGSVKLNVGSYDQQDLFVSAQTGGDTFRAGVSFANLNRNGFGNNLITGTENYDKDITAGRVSAEWHPRDDFSAKFAYDYTKDTSNSKGGHRLFVSNATQAPVLDSVYDTRYGMSHENLVETKGGSLTLTWDCCSNVQVKSITSYRSGFTDTPIDFDNLPAQDLDVPAIYDDEQWTQEFQMAWTGERSNLVAGVYFYDGSATGSFDVVLNELGGALGLPGFIAQTSGSVDTNSAAIYANYQYQLTDALQVTVGGRFTKDEKDAQVFKGNWFAPTSAGAPAVVLTNYTNKKDWEQFSPRLAIDYKMSDETMVYGSYSEGFKSGGFDMRGDQTANPETVNGFNPEEVWTVEAGFKTQLLDNRMRLNAAIFYTDYTDMQVTIQQAVDSDGDGVNDNYVSSVENAGEAEMKGFELEGQFAVSESFTLTGVLGVIDASFVDFATYDAQTGALLNTADQLDIAGTPDFNYSLTANYNYSLGDAGDLEFNATYSYRDDYQVFETPSVLDQEGYGLLSAGVMFVPSSEKYKIHLYANNLTDEQYRLAGYNFPTLGLEGSVIGYYGDPRTVTLSASMNF